ncbi:MAG: NFACT family protein [Clostridiales Family XIII bacterium]|jgi:predicted ribosome quality control (RQC) complex YloA/Tae2 family protein|nr:NFACT family protein [Clostridiales Family XIII bacterium]
MPYDNYVTAAVAAELRTRIAGGRIEKIYQPGREEALLHISAPGNARSRLALLLSAESRHPAAYLTEADIENPASPPAFCMLLRKHLLGGRIEGVSATPRERILSIDITSTGELGLPREYRLLLEIMGKHSNLFLIDRADGKILDCIKRVFPEMSKVRQALPGMTYTPPPPAKGYSPVIQRECESGKSLADFDSLAEAEDFCPRIYLGAAGTLTDFHVLPIAAYAPLACEEFSSVSAMLDRWYSVKDEGNRLKQKSADLTKAISGRLEKLYLKKQRLLEDIRKAEDADRYKATGQLITANIYRIKKGDGKVSLPDYSHPDPETGAPAEVTVNLDPLLTPAENAQRYFKKYTKAKASLTVKREQLALTSADIDFLETYQVYLLDCASAAEIDDLREELAVHGIIRRRKNAPKKKQKAEPDFLTFKTRSGLTVLVGRNNRENDILTLKKAAPGHLWLHTKDIPGSHVILAAAESRRDERSILEAAQIAAWYSKARASANVPVDYTEVRHVKKPGGAKPGMVIFTHNKTLFVEPKVP